MLKVVSHVHDATCFLRYDLGLTLEVQAVRHGVHEAVRKYDFRNQSELASVLVPLTLQNLDGVRRV